MIFYALLSYVICPFLFYSRKNTLANAGNGFVVGSIISIVLWFTVGQKMV
jgi:riboflavin transporter FmnP